MNKKNHQHWNSYSSWTTIGSIASNWNADAICHLDEERLCERKLSEKQNLLLDVGCSRPSCACVCGYGYRHYIPSSCTAFPRVSSYLLGLGSIGIELSSAFSLAFRKSNSLFSCFSKYYHCHWCWNVRNLPIILIDSQWWFFEISFHFRTIFETSVCQENSTYRERSTRMGIHFVN